MQSILEQQVERGENIYIKTKAQVEASSRYSSFFFFFLLYIDVNSIRGRARAVQRDKYIYLYIYRQWYNLHITRPVALAIYMYICTCIMHFYACARMSARETLRGVEFKERSKRRTAQRVSLATLFCTFLNYGDEKFTVIVMLFK